MAGGRGQTGLNSCGMRGEREGEQAGSVTSLVGSQLLQPLTASGSFHRLGPGGVLHGHLSVRRARDPSHPRRHPAWSRRWDLVLHHAKVGETHRRYGGPPISFIKRLSGEQHMGLGPTLGLSLAEEVRPPLPGQLTVSLYKLLMILKCYGTQEVFNEK